MEQKIRYIPRVYNSIIKDFGISFDTIFVDAHTLVSQKDLVDKLRTVCSRVIINPGTNRLSHINAQPKSFQKLPFYISQEKLEKLFSDPSYRLSEFVKPAIGFQLDRGADIVLIPYLYFDDLNSSNASTNLSLIVDSIKHYKSLSQSKPLYATICVGSKLLESITAIEDMVGRYTDSFFINDIQGFVVLVDDFDFKNVDEGVLLGLIHLIFQLSSIKETLVGYVGQFGEILSIIGASGFVSGIDKGEGFSLDSFNMVHKGRMGRGEDFTYIPEILAYLNDQDVLKVGYKCPCSSCNGSFPTDLRTKQSHFLLRKQQCAEELSSVNGDKRKDFMLDKLTKAKALGMQYKSRYGVKINISYLDKALNALANFRGEYFTDDAVELDKLLDKLDEDINATKVN